MVCNQLTINVRKLDIRQEATLFQSRDNRRWGPVIPKKRKSKMSTTAPRLWSKAQGHVNKDSRGSREQRAEAQVAQLVRLSTQVGAKNTQDPEIPSRSLEFWLNSNPRKKLSTRGAVNEQLWVHTGFRTIQLSSNQKKTEFSEFFGI